VPVGELLVHPRLEIAVGPFALEERIAQEEDAVTVFDLERLSGTGGEGEGEEERAEEAHGAGGGENREA
jgi:hypothetical protein